MFFQPKMVISRVKILVYKGSPPLVRMVSTSMNFRAIGMKFVLVEFFITKFVLVECFITKFVIVEFSLCTTPLV